MWSHKLLAVSLPLVTLAGCVAFDESGAPAEGSASLARRLASREQLALEQPSLVGVAAYGSEGQPLPCVQPNVLAGRAVLRSTEDTRLLLVEDLDLDLSDVRIAAGVVYDEPIDFTDIRLRLGTQIVVEPTWHADGRRADGIGRADLLMDWAVLTDDGQVLPLATQRLRDVEFAVEARLTDDGDVTAAVTATVDGPVWRFGEKVSITDFSMAVNARTVAAP